MHIQSLTVGWSGPHEQPRAFLRWSAESTAEERQLIGNHRVPNWVCEIHVRHCPIQHLLGPSVMRHVYDLIFRHLTQSRQKTRFIVVPTTFYRVLVMVLYKITWFLSNSTWNNAMVRLGYTYPRTKFMVMVPAHGHAGAPHDCDHALMVVIPTELSHVTLAIYENCLVEPQTWKLLYYEQNRRIR